MPKYKKKPVEVEAIKVRDILQSAKQRFQGMPTWIERAFDDGVVAFASHYLMISTSSGQVRANASDWIIRGPVGELYPIEKEVFEASYELVPEPKPGPPDLGGGVPIDTPENQPPPDPEQAPHPRF